jgi:hypothetical protein
MRDTTLPNPNVKQPSPPKPKRQSKLEALRAQGQWIEAEPYFALPKPELQSEWEDAVAKRIRGSLAAGGFRRVGAPNRDHPFHSDLLRTRVDALVACFPDYIRELDTDKGRGKYRRSVLRADKEAGWPLDGIDEHIESRIKMNLALWKEAFEQYRDIRNNPFWRGTASYKQIMCPDDGPPLPDGPPPMPVYVSPTSELVLTVANGHVTLCAKPGAL